MPPSTNPSMEITADDVASPFFGADPDVLADEELSAEDEALIAAEMDESIDLEAEATAAADAAAEAELAEANASPSDEEVAELAAAQDEEVTDVADPAAEVTDPAAAEDEGDTTAAAEAETDEPAPAPGIMIPKARLDQALRRAREAEQALAAAAASKNVATAREELAPFEFTPDVEAITKGLDSAIDGKVSEGATAIAQMMSDAVQGAVKHTQAQMQSEIDAAAQAATAEAVAQSSAALGRGDYDSTVATIEESYPFLNPDNEDIYDPAMVGRASGLASAYEQEGFSPAEALSKGVADMIKLHRPELLEATDDTAAAGEAETAAPVTRATPADRKRNAETASAQPARVAGEPNSVQDEAALDLDTMSDEEFDALPESMKAQLRGDVL